MTDHPHAADPGTAAAPPATADGDGFTPPDYDPADYRWVPVRRTPRYDGWTEEKQRRFIETLADTGQVGRAARAVGMSRESAYKLRRAPHAAAFARAWDAARDQAGTYLEDVAFERAVEGVEHNVYDEYGNVVCTKRVHNDRLLMFLLRHLKPERYARDALARPVAPVAVDATLRALEPRPPADVERLLPAEELDDALRLADAADDALPQFLCEQRPVPTPAQAAATARRAQLERGKAAQNKLDRKEGPLDKDEFADLCVFLDPTSGAEPSRGRYR